MDGARKNALLEMLVDIRRVTAHDQTTHSRIRTGQLRQLTTSLYIDAAQWKSLEPFEQEFLRSCAASRQSTKAILVGFSAARVCGVWVHYDTKPGVQVALPSGKPPSAKAQSPGIEYKRMAVPDEDVVNRAGIRFTNAVRTAIDIARSTGERSGIVAFESLLTGCSGDQADLIRQECGAMMQRMRGDEGHRQRTTRACEGDQPLRVGVRNASASHLGRARHHLPHPGAHRPVPGRHPRRRRDH